MATPTFSVYTDNEIHSEGFVRPARKLTSKERAGLQDSGQKFPKAKALSSFQSTRTQPLSTGSFKHPLSETTTIPPESSNSSSKSTSYGENTNVTRSSSADSSSYKEYKEHMNARRVEIAAMVDQMLSDHPEDVLTVPEMGMEPDVSADIASWIFPKERMEAELEMMTDKKPLRLRGLREISNMDVREEEMDLPCPVIEDYCERFPE